MCMSKTGFKCLPNIFPGAMGRHRGYVKRERAQVRELEKQRLNGGTTKGKPAILEFCRLRN